MLLLKIEYTRLICKYDDEWG